MLGLKKFLLSRLAIIGSNDLGILIAHHAIADKWDLAGFFDNKKPEGTAIGQFGKVLGDVDSVEEHFRNGAFDRLIVGVGYTQFEFRKAVFARFKGSIPFANIVHSFAYVDPSVSLGEGNVILPGCVLDMEAGLGDNILLNTGCRIAHDSRIGDHCFIGPGVTIAGKVTIEECCFIGVGSTILDNVKIPQRTLVGGGAVVTKDITVAGTYIGIPAKKIKENIYFEHQ